MKQPISRDGSKQDLEVAVEETAQGLGAVEKTAKGLMVGEETAQGVVAGEETAQGRAWETVLELTWEKAQEVAPGVVPVLAQETAQGMALEMVLQQPHRIMQNTALVKGSEGIAVRIRQSARRLWL